MKRPLNLSSTLVLCLFLTMSSLIAAEREREMSGPSVGGGGDAMVMADDSVVLADAWLDQNSSQPNYASLGARALHPRLRKNISDYEKIVKDLGVMLSSKSGLSKGDIVRELQRLSSVDNLKFYAVADADELNRSCRSGGSKKYALPAGTSVMQVACTKGNDTFIVEPIFKKLSLKEQTLLLIHERLTTLRDVAEGKNYSAIARFTSGLRTYAALYREQSKGKYRLLSKDEIQKLSDFYYSYEELEKRASDLEIDSFDYIPHVNGGGLIHRDALVAKSAFIGLNTFLLVTRPEAVVIRENAFLKGARIAADSIEIGEGTRILNSVVAYITEDSAGYDLYLAPNQNIVGHSINATNLEKYYPYGVRYKNLPARVAIPPYYVESQYGPMQMLQPIPDALYVEHVEFQDMGKAGIFSSKRRYKVSHFFIFTQDEYIAARDKSAGGKVMMISKDGKLVRAGLPKTFFWHITAPGSQTVIQNLVPRAQCVGFICKVSPEGEY